MVELERLRATGVAVSRLDECTRRQVLTATDFKEVAQGLLTAIRSDVQAFTVEETGHYINTSLLVEDIEDSSKLEVVAPAIPNRVNRSYPKSDLLVWQAMVKQRLVFERKFNQVGKPYHSILVIPLLLDTAVSTQSIGAVSIDSGRSGEFDEDVVRSLEERLYPYTALLGLLLGLQMAFRKENDDGTST